jgi:glutathionylspermidine synthase
VTIVDAAGAVIEKQPGAYGDEGFVYQQRADTATIDGKNVVIGSWVVGESPAGIDVRETSSLITGDLAEFVPHFIDEEDAR